MYSPKSYRSAVLLIRDRIIAISPNTHSFRGEDPLVTN